MALLLLLAQLTLTFVLRLFFIMFPLRLVLFHLLRHSVTVMNSFLLCNFTISPPPLILTFQADSDRPLPPLDPLSRMSQQSSRSREALTFRRLNESDSNQLSGLPRPPIVSTLLCSLHPYHPLSRRFQISQMTALRTSPLSRR